MHVEKRGGGCFTNRMLTWAFTVFLDLDMRAVREEEALTKTAGCDGAKDALSAPEVATRKRSNQRDIP